MCSESSHNGSPINWVLPPGMNSRVLGGSFKVNWLNRNELPFAKVQNLYNPWNDNKPIKIARDGTEFEPNIGKQLCCSFPSDPTTDVVALIK
uniref:YTH domain-containing protein n=1 Tax=Romanomermis culicivorax TaxID=13658 RepID=A0A915KU77_ROMCU